MAQRNQFTDMGTEPTAQIPFMRRKSFIVAIFFFILLAGAGVYFLYRGGTGAASPAGADDDVASLVRLVGKLIVLPENETPTIATVTDPSKLANQPFFANAEEGDKVLIYTNARKAVLYSPRENKIVEVAPIDINNLQAPASNQGGAPPAGENQ